MTSAIALIAALTFGQVGTARPPDLAEIVFAVRAPNREDNSQDFARGNARRGRLL